MFHPELDSNLKEDLVEILIDYLEDEDPYVNGYLLGLDIRISHISPRQPLLSASLLPAIPHEP